MTPAPSDLSGLRFHIRTFGCQMNEDDSARLAGALVLSGARPADSLETSDLILVNTCAVRAKSVEKLDSFLGRLQALKRRRPLLIGVVGCVAQLEREGLLRRKPGLDFLVGPGEYARLPGIVAAGAARKTAALGRTRRWVEAPPPLLPEDATSASVTVMEGCDNFCAYCVVPFARGREKFRPLESVLAEIRRLAGRGMKEILLLGQNVNVYRDPASGREFPDLLRAAAAVDGPSWIRFLTSHPKSLTPATAETMASTPKICRQLHLPLQAGSSTVLKRMKRGYSRERYLEIVGHLRSLMPEIRLSSDIIVGYPGESEEEFRETLSALEDIRFASIFSFKYSPRPLTAASRLEDDVPREVKRRRLLEVQALQKEIQTRLHQSFVGRVERVLCSGRSRRDPAVFAGRNEGNQVINFRAEGDVAGRFVDVEIVAAGPYSLRGLAVGKA